MTLALCMELGAVEPISVLARRNANDPQEGAAHGFSGAKAASRADGFEG